MYQSSEHTLSVAKSCIFNTFQLCPDYEGIELGIGESLLIKAISVSTGRSLATVKADLKKEGDLGLVAMVQLLLLDYNDI